MKWIFLFIIVSMASFFAWRLRPVMGIKECYNHKFPKVAFLAKLASPVPEWMTAQLDADFKEIPPVTVSALEKAYRTIEKRLGNPIFLHHYRILDNQLYKYVPSKRYGSSRDRHYEKALKTLLSHVSLPDLDFILCPMDGIPEPDVPSTFYRMDDPQDQVPILGQAKLKEPLTRFIILIPDQLSLSLDWMEISEEISMLNRQNPWESKIEKAFWRGGISDFVEEAGVSPRFALCRLSKHYPDLIDAASDYRCPLSHLAKEEDLPCFTSWTSKEEHLRYKYQLTLDGRMCTYPGFQWRLLSNSLTMKQDSLHIQYFYSALKPYVHYLPIANDMSDLAQKVQWARTHEKDVLEMIQNAQAFALENLQYEDVYRYFYLVLQAYARLQRIDFKSLKQATRNDPAWVNIHYRKRLEFYKILSRIWKRNRAPLQSQSTT